MAGGRGGGGGRRHHGRALFREPREEGEGGGGEGGVVSPRKQGRRRFDLFAGRPRIFRLEKRDDGRKEEEVRGVDTTRMRDDVGSCSKKGDDVMMHFAGVREKRMTSRNGDGERDGHGRIDRSVGRSVGERLVAHYSPGSPPCARPMSPPIYLVLGINRVRVGDDGREETNYGRIGIRLLLSGPPRRGRRWFRPRHSVHFAGLEMNRYIILDIVCPFSLSRFSLSPPAPSPPPPSAHLIHPYRAHRACVRACPEREKHADDGRAGPARSVHKNK
jgi:hypothetical protein